MTNPSAHIQENPSDERYASQVEHVSSEGRPGDPRLRSTRLRVLMVSLAAVLFLIAAVFAWRFNAAAGISVAVIGLIFLFANPVVWAGLSRASEREKVEQKTG